MISRSTGDHARPAALCLEDAELAVVSNENTDHSGMFTGRCLKGGKTTAQVTFWYFPNGQYDLTIEDCGATGCADGWFWPI